MRAATVKAESRKAEILNAALKCFNTRGYYKTSLDDVAQRLGITKAAIYYYFKSKKKLFIEVFHSNVDRYFDAISKGLNYTSNDPIGYIDNRIKKSGEIFKKNIDVFKFCLEFISVSAREPDLKMEVTHFYEHRVADFSTMMRKGIEDGKFHHCDAESIGVILYFLSMGFFLTYFTVNKNIAYKKYFSNFNNIFYKAIKIQK
jgi:AcrR family transcriptional regulator